MISLLWRMLSRSLPVFVGIGIVLLWELAVVVLDIAPFLLPRPSAVIREMWAERDQLLTQSVPTVIEIWAGFGLALVIGFLLALPIAYSRTVDRLVMPVIVTFQVVPKVALAPLFLVWLGFGMAPKIWVAALIAFFPILVNTIRGLRSVDAELVQWMSTLGAPRHKIFRKLSFPWAMPYLFAAMKVSISFSVVGAIVGEFIGTDRGLGYILLTSTVVLDTDLTFAAIVTIGILGVMSYGVVAAAERILLPWQVSLEGPPQTL